ncbi:hypothetical protein [Halalkalibacter okhensis]|uniref:Uncharacterized protein n=1 Tax=Halalkalibacter okhensis TaxID=333138 RepID=A0A0B0IHF5_9BACI|nr:hypothetical protein [Halalkalibacter okhensis]KHF40730.1 hypothetical protein LQ50_08075 [Halalkalibacter okhensis]
MSKLKSINEEIRKLEKDLDEIFEAHGNEPPEELLERFGYIQGYLDALNVVKDELELLIGR